MKAVIMYRNQWEKYPVQVEISDNCPVCGGPRGKLIGHNFHEDGESYFVHRWDNPCGHIDKYADVYREAKGVSMK
jgi:hypothetical protein